MESLLFSAFEKGNPPRVNFLDLISGIIIYGSFSWKLKVKFLVLVFNTDQAGKISKNELAIMVTSSLRAIGIMTGASLPSNSLLANVANLIFK